MHLRDYRDELWREVDHAPGGSPEAIIRGNKALTRGLYDLFNESPYLFRQANRVLHLDADLVPEDDTDTLEMGEDVGPVRDAWVVQTTYSSADPKYTKWGALERQLDGRTLRITDPDDETYFRFFRIREMWTEAPNGQEPFTLVVRMSLVEPLPFDWVGKTFAWRILTSEYAIPNDIQRLAGISVDIKGRTFPVEVVHEGEPEDLAAVDHSHDLSAAGSRPFTAYRRASEGLARPLVPATILVSGKDGAWDVIVNPEGSFEYFWTLSMGLRHREDAFPDPRRPIDSYFDTTRLAPYWESAPSPVSAIATIPAGGAVTAELSFPDIQRIIGFSETTRLRYQHTGLYINIYRRRVAADSGGLDYASEHAHYMTRIKVDGTTTWVDNGTILPADSVPLRDNTRYQTFRFHPFPDGDYRIRMRAYIRPIPPLDDFEDMPVPDDAQNGLLYLAAQHFYRSAGNAAAAAGYVLLFEKARKAIAKLYGQAIPRKDLARRGMARVRRATGGTHRRVPTGLVDV